MVGGLVTCVQGYQPFALATLVDTLTLELQCQSSGPPYGTPILLVESVQKIGMLAS